MNRRRFLAVTGAAATAVAATPVPSGASEQAEVSRRKLERRSAERDASAARRRVGDVEAAIEDLDADEPDK